jgi:hypothetical protein
MWHGLAWFGVYSTFAMNLIYMCFHQYFIFREFGIGSKINEIFSSKKRIVCPECDGQLAVWYEMAIVYSRKIDPKTGDIKPRISKSDIEGTDLQGLKCTACD